MHATRRVRQLRLRAPDAACMRRALVTLEDALRTASLPDAGGRIVLVRRLALGRFDPRAPPATLALRIERAVARMVVTVHGADASAAHADAVWFRDALDAHVALARRVVRGPPPHEWFWRCVAPRAGTARTADHALHEIACSLAGLPEAAVALPRWRAAVQEISVGGVPALAFASGACSAASPNHGSKLRADPAPRTDSAGARNAAVADDAPLHRTVPPTNPGDAWGAAERQLPAPLDRRARAAPDCPATGARARVQRTRCENGSMRPAQGQAYPPTNASTVRRAAEVDDLRVTEVGARGAATMAGGLPLLLNALARLGYAEWLDAQPVWANLDIARRVFAGVLARLRVPPSDPAWTLVEGIPVAPSPSSFTAPARWRGGLLAGHGPVQRRPVALFDASGRLLLAASRGPLETDVVHAWTTALRRWLRRYARVGLATLILRPGLIAATPTHVDLHFDHHLADLRIRRAGLDLDPGWLPWFGRVVRFHYDCVTTQ